MILKYIPLNSLTRRPPSSITQSQKNKKCENFISPNVRRYAMFLRPKGVKIWEKEKEYPLKILYTLFLEPHIGCYVL